ncbi:MAG: hypothetical protein IPM35_41130 [Myxococcales bacterium]|nr:hypothetical protein [Myxococcales bacterium]
MNIALLNPIIADKRYEGMFDGDPRIAELAQALVGQMDFGGRLKLIHFRQRQRPTRVAWNDRRRQERDPCRRG